MLPLLPNQTFGPLNILNPYEIWLIVVLISSISFISYVAIKVGGTQTGGLEWGGFLGGLTSSTAVSLSFSQMSKKTNKVVNPFVFGILIACSAMFFSLLTISILNADLVKILYIPMFSMGGLGLPSCSLFLV